METDKTDRRAKSETKPEHSSLETLTQMGLRRRATAIVAGVSVVTAASTVGAGGAAPATVGSARRQNEEGRAQQQQEAHLHGVPTKKAFLRRKSSAHEKGEGFETQEARKRIQTFRNTIHHEDADGRIVIRTLEHDESTVDLALDVQEDGPIAASATTGDDWVSVGVMGVADESALDVDLVDPQARREIQNLNSRLDAFEKERQPRRGTGGIKLEGGVDSRDAASRGDKRFGGGVQDREGEGKGRRLATSSGGNDGATYYVEVKSSTGKTSTYWNGALWTLAVDIPVFGQSKKHDFVYGRGTITQEEQMEEKTAGYTVERGCYYLWTTQGTRPFDVEWSISVDGVDIPNGSGGGADRHTFGVGGALCGLSTCYRQCYNDWQDESTDECASYGDLLAPPTEPAGAKCTCTEEEELALRLTCLNTEKCDNRSQCYLINDAVAEVSTSHVIKVCTYMTIEGSTVDTQSAEQAIAIWLNLDAQYVELVLVNGKSPVTYSRRNRRRILLKDHEDQYYETDGPRVEHGRGKKNQRSARNRRLQSKNFRRFEYHIIAPGSADRSNILETIKNGVRDLNTVLGSQEEGSGLQNAEAYTATYSVVEENVASAEVPSVSIAGTGIGGVGNTVVVEATSAPADSEHFTRSAQFIVGAGLVVVVSVVLSFVACIVCNMKRKEKKAFRENNAPVGGQPKPVEFVDPWGSLIKGKYTASSATRSTAGKSQNGTSGGGSTQSGQQPKSGKGSRNGSERRGTGSK